MPDYSAIAICAASYIAGSIPFGYIMGRLRGVDVRAQGSGNIGATNVARTVGKKLGVLVLLLDALKGAAPVLVAMWLVSGGRAPEWAPAAAASAAIVGHCFPVWLRFRGGKGVATSFGAFLALAPEVAALAAALFAIIYIAFRVVSIGSLIAALAVPTLLFLFGYSQMITLLALFAALVVIVKHQANIRRLFKREELKV